MANNSTTGVDRVNRLYIKEPMDRYKEPWYTAALDHSKQLGLQLSCSGGAGAVARTAVAPLERIKVLMQVQPMGSLPAQQHYKGLPDACRQICLREGGWKALYRGNGANVIRLMPDVAFRFYTHDQFRTMFSTLDGQPPGFAGKLAAGALTGVAKTVLFHPLDLCRIRLTADTSPPGAKQYTSLRHCFVDTWRREGIRGLYRGMPLSMLSVVPYLSISFATYDTLKQQMPQDKHSKGEWWYPFLQMGCAAFAAVLAQTLTYPLDTVRRRQQMSGALGQKIRYQNALDCIRQVGSKEGFQAFMRGAGINCLKTVPGAVVQFVTYDAIKSGFQALDPTTGVTSPL